MICKLPFTFYFNSLIQFLTSEQKSHFVHGKRLLLNPPPPPPPPPNIVTAIGRFAWRREWTLSLNYYKNSNYKILRRNQQKIKIFFVKFQAPFSQKIINIQLNISCMYSFYMFNSLSLVTAK